MAQSSRSDLLLPPQAEIVLTLDIDWAPDFVIDQVAAILLEHGVKATWFVTHESRAVDRLRERSDLFELGIHPNFLSGSSHGAEVDEVLDFCMDLVPEAVSMRTHSLVQSTPILRRVLFNTPVRQDVSLYLPRGKNLDPVQFRLADRHLTRHPYGWEDDLEMEYEDPIFHPDGLDWGGSKTHIFDFHPMHVALNSASMDNYNSLKKAVPKLFEATPSQVEACANPHEGAGTMFRHLIELAAAHRADRRIRDLLAEPAGSGV